MIQPETDLFGEAIKPGATMPPPPGTDKRRKTVPRGYAAPPGTGPAGETCRGCVHYAVVGGHAKNYRKCALVKARWTHGPGTDILARSPACNFFEKNPK